MNRHSKVRHHRLLLAVCVGSLMSLPRASGAQQPPGKIVGARLRTPRPFNLVRIPESQKAAATATMQKLYDVMRRDTMFYEPVTYDIQPSARIDMPPRAGYTPVEYDVPQLLYAAGKDIPVTVAGKAATSSTAIYVFGNGLGHFWRATDKWRDDEKGEMYWEPPRQPDVKGFPSYGKGLVVIKRSERPIFLPVPLERAMRLVIANNKKGIEDMKDPSQKTIVALTQACITKLEQELSALSPADRAGPTYLATTRVPGHDGACDPFSSASDPQARRVIYENPDFYDRTLPPTAIQVVFVNLASFNPVNPDQRAQLERLTTALDVAGLAALTEKPTASP